MLVRFARGQRMARGGTGPTVAREAL